MAETAIEPALQAFLEGPREELHLVLCSRTTELISALQERKVEKARQIAAQLHQALHFCVSDCPSYFLAQIVTLLYNDDVFVHCDELSVGLLALEHELDRLRHTYGGPAASSIPVSGCRDSWPVSTLEPELEHSAVAGR